MSACDLKSNVTCISDTMGRVCGCSLGLPATLDGCHFGLIYMQSTVCSSSREKIVNKN